MKFKILIADDDEDFAQSLSLRLEHEGFATAMTHEGIRTIEFAHQYCPDIILLDERMPAGKGSSVLAALRAQPETESVPVIILSALTDPELQALVESVGAQAFFRKPCDLAALVAKIRELLPNA